jgi:hypothetical protein
VSRKSQRKAERSQLVEAMKSYVEFPWDYSYIAWKDRPLDVRREMIRWASLFGRCWIQGRTETLMDVYKYDARKTYNENWDGCRDVWKEHYRWRKRLKYSDRQIKNRDPKLIEYERQAREREQAEHDEFNRQQERTYQTWLRLRRAAHERLWRDVAP